MTWATNFVTRCFMAIVVLVGLGAVRAEAHESRPAIAILSIDKSGAVELEVRLDLEAALAGLPLHETTEANAYYQTLRALDPDALRLMFERAAQEFVSGYEVRFDGVAAPPALRELDIPATGDTTLPRISTLRLAISVPRRPATLSLLAPLSADDSVLRIVEAADGRVLYAGLLPKGHRSPEIDLNSSAVPDLSFWRYVVLGFEHIVPKGLDHILFVTGLFLLNPRLRPLLVQVSAFTLAHSITLALGIYGVLRLSPSIVEPLIAGSIVFVAIENLTTDRLRGWRSAVVFGFGLLHGLGFAGVLMEIGLSQQNFLAALAGFNIGVELGQGAVLASCFLAIGFWFRHRGWYRPAFAMPASAGIALIGTYWLVERMP